MILGIQMKRDTKNNWLSGCKANEGKVVMLKINLEKIILAVGAVALFMVFPFIWWWYIIKRL